MCLIQHAKEGSLRNQNLRGFDPQRLKNTVAFTCQGLSALCWSCILRSPAGTKEKARSCEDGGRRHFDKHPASRPLRGGASRISQERSPGFGFASFPSKSQTTGNCPPRADCCQPIKSGFQQGPGGWKMPLQALGGQVVSRVQHHSRFQ